MKPFSKLKEIYINKTISVGTQTYIAHISIFFHKRFQFGVLMSVIWLSFRAINSHKRPKSHIQARQSIFILFYQAFKSKYKFRTDKYIFTYSDCMILSLTGKWETEIEGAMYSNDRCNYSLMCKKTTFCWHTRYNFVPRSRYHV